MSKIACFVSLFLLVVSVLSTDAAQVLPVPTNIVVENDDRVATIWWNNFSKNNAQNPAGVYGYQIT